MIGLPFSFPHSLVFLLFSRFLSLSWALGFSWSKMERNPQENVKNDGDSSKEKGKLDFYFWVAEEVKNAYFLYTDL